MTALVILSWPGSYADVLARVLRKAASKVDVVRTVRDQRSEVVTPSPEDYVRRLRVVAGELAARAARLERCAGSGDEIEAWHEAVLAAEHATAACEQLERPPTSDAAGHPPQNDAGPATFGAARSTFSRRPVVIEASGGW